MWSYVHQLAVILLERFSDMHLCSKTCCSCAKQFNDVQLCSQKNLPERFSLFMAEPTKYIAILLQVHYICVSHIDLQLFE